MKKNSLRAGIIIILLSAFIFSSSHGADAASSVVISNVRINDLSTGYADVGWNTDVPADSVVEWGIVGSGLPNRVPSATPVTTHQLRLEPLTANTTYEYRVGSKLDSESEDDRAWFPESGTITFTTPAGAGGGGGDEGPVLTGVQVNANCCRATFNFTTSEPAAYELTITNGPNAVGNSSASGAGEYRSDWTVRYPDDFTNNILLQASSNYEYRIELTDSNGNYRSYGPLSFQTGRDEFDFVFTPGICQDGTPIGQCNVDGFLCGPGGLVINCEVCGFQCQVGETCRNGGACTTDPGLGNDAFQCNPSSCYGRACEQTGHSCLTDADCGGGDSCSEGVFLNPAGPGCYGSWNKCNANVVVQVDRDRVCNKWMTCRTQTQVTNPTTQITENFCYDLAACSAIGPNGECAKPLFGKYCVGDPLRFCTSGNDCDSGLCKPASGTYCSVPFRPSADAPYEYRPCEVGDDMTCQQIDPSGRCIEFLPENVTYVTPNDVQKIRYLSGSVKAGLQWTAGVSFTHQGQFPWYYMPQEGSLVPLGNESFENRVTQTTTKSDGSQQTTIEYTESPWTAVGDQGTDGTAPSIIVVPEDGSGQTNPNHVLKVDPSDTVSGAQAPSIPFSTLEDAEYIISFRIRSSVPDGQDITARLVAPDGSVVPLWQGEINASWQNIISKAGDEVAGGSARLQIVRTGQSAEPFFIDDVSLNVVLGVSKVGSGTLLNYVPRSCRLYPGEDSLLCEYRDDSGVRYKGWYGYCLEKDPKFAGRCISWWPVDIIGGETDVFGTFGSEVSAGYQDRSPLYMCLEAKGVTGGDTVDHDGASDDISPSTREGNWRFLRSTIQGWESTARDFEGFLCNDNLVSHYGGQSLLGGCDDDDFFGDTNGDGQWDGFERFYFDERNSDPSHFRWDPEDNFYQDQIIQICLFEKASSHSDWHIGTLCMSEETSWQIRWESAPGSNFLHIDAEFDASNRRLASFSIWANDRSDDHGGFMAAVGVQLREICTKVVKVVNEDGQNRAWASRVSVGSGYVTRATNYNLTQDLAPFGGVVQPSGDPTQWREPLFVEAPRTNEAYPFPYQSRAGSPAACKGNCASRVCIGGGIKDGELCRTADDCRSPQGDQGVCSGVGTCSQSLKACSGNRDSSGACRDVAGGNIDDDLCCSAVDPDDVCIGGVASNAGNQAYSTDDQWFCAASGAWCYCANEADCAANPNGDDHCGRYQVGDTCESYITDVYAGALGIDNLQRIFAESYGFWTWNPTKSNYEAQPINADATLGTKNWQPPSQECRSCNSTTPLACTQIGSSAECGSAVCEWNGARGAYNLSSIAADYCGVRPRAYNFFVNDQQAADVTDGQWVSFKFNSSADAQQLPLNSLLIDWSDGQQQSVYFPYAPKADAGNPHVLSHRYFCSPSTLENLPTCDSNAKTRTYPCAGPAGGAQKQYCVYQPRVVIKDNWGWCNSVPPDFQSGQSCGACPGGQACHPLYGICVDQSYLSVSCDQNNIGFPPTWQDYTPNKPIEVRVQPIGS